MRAIYAIIALVMLGLSTRSGDGRVLTHREKASLVGGDDVYTTLNSCCQTASNCVLPTSKQCSQYGTRSCQSGTQTDYFYTSNNQKECQGTWVSHICTSTVSSVSCVVSYDCVYNPANGSCTEDVSSQAGYEFAPTSCTPDCPQPDPGS